jgi:hypothetical protein
MFRLCLFVTRDASGGFVAGEVEIAGKVTT